MFKQAIGGANKQGIHQVSSLNNFIQVRTATKKVSGSKTNKNDSAGRRLGPKAHENHLVKPGQIIMRQRGTKIHPGENVKIGIDHTIYAVEPGYVCFYYDPFHPLRKYVGVSLKKELKLPTPHFSPRVRRFGYELISNPIKAQQEEDWKSSKEIQAQNSILAKVKEGETAKLHFIESFTQYISKESIAVNEKDLEIVSHRFYEISQFIKNGQSVEEAKIQATFNYLYDLKLASVNAGESEEELVKSKTYYSNLFNELDAKVEVDGKGELFAATPAEEKSAKQASTIELLNSKYHNRLLSSEEKSQVLSLIETLGLFSAAKQDALKNKFLPAFIPLTVPGSVITEIDAENPPKGVVVQRIYDEATRSTKVIGRPKEVV